MAHFLQKLSRIFELVLTNDFVEDLLGKDPDFAVLVDAEAEYILHNPLRQALQH